MPAPIVQVLFKGRMLKSISFEGDTLRIGRLRENDIVIDNLSVSRFHAVLTRRDDRVFIEDCTSENGVFVNGMRFERGEVRPGDEIMIGKHQLVLREAGEVEDEAEPPRPAPPGPSQPWDAAKTYFMGPDTMAGALGHPAPKREAPPLREEPAANPAPGPFGKPPPLLPATPVPPVVPAPPVAPVAAVPPLAPAPEPFAPAEPSAPAMAGGEFDVSGFDLPVVPDEDAPDPLALEPPPKQEALFPGFVLQSAGKLDRVLRWEKDRLTVGRSGECDIVLGHSEVSRRHALFHREGERFEVRDLDSINGILVNGERIKRRELAVGDVVKIEDFEFTFVLEPQPIGNEIKTDTQRPAAPGAENDHDLTVLEELSPFPMSSPPSSLDEITEPTGPEVPRRPREPLRTRPPAAPRRFTARTPAPRPSGGAVCVELRLRAEDLPEPLRALLEQAEDGVIPVQAELRLRRD